jgi:tetraacyldisaccharide 4'-kinase
VTPAELIYYAGYSVKKRLVQKRGKRLSRPVISIGNITVGGTGKTPAAIAVAEEAKKRGYCPVILTRGYRGKMHGPCFVSDGRRVLMSVAEAGDEPVIMAERLGDVPVVKSADRYEGGLFAIRNLPAGSDSLIFILDDGFQHWRLARDVEIVLVDGINPFGNRRLLPFGPLRGPLTELGKADIMVVTKVNNYALAAELRTINNHTNIYSSHYDVSGLRRVDRSFSDAGILAGKRAFAFCGIANPVSFRNTLEQLGCNLLGMKDYRDHHSYTEPDMKELSDSADRLCADYIVTTEKDMVKVRELKGFPKNLFSVEVSFAAEEGFFEDIFSRVKSSGSQR